jgi:Na+/proline symporter
MSLTTAIGYFIPTLLLAIGNAKMSQRFFSAKNEKEAKKSVIGWVIGVIILGIGIQSLAVIGSSMFKGLPTNEAGRIILKAAHQGVPLVVGCILIAAVVAVVVSTANSFLLVPATNVMRDIVQRFIKPNISDKAMVLGTRITLVVLGFLSYALIGFFPRILRAAYAAYTIYGAGLTPALMATFFWKRATPKAGVISILAGMSVTVEWEIFNKIFGLYPLGIPAVYPALISSVALLILVSYLDTPPDKKKWQPFFN